MDVLYYWKDFAKDLKASRIGWLPSSKTRLGEFQADHADNIWALNTPPGSKGKLQLLARMAWSLPGTPTSAPKGQGVVHYNVNDPRSVCFIGGDDAETVARLSDWAQLHFPAAFRNNFQGVNGQQALRGGVLHELNQIAKGLETRPFPHMPS